MIFNFTNILEIRGLNCPTLEYFLQYSMNVSEKIVILVKMIFNSVSPSWESFLLVTDLLSFHLGENFSIQIKLINMLEKIHYYRDETFQPYFL